MKIKLTLSHTNLNTFIAVLGLTLASVTAWYQFRSQPDKLTATSEGRVNFGQLAKINSFGNPLLSSDRPNQLVGPVYWKVFIYNELDRPISLVKIEAFLQSDSGGRIQYTGLRDSMVYAENPQRNLNLPINLGPREGRAIYVGLNIPVESEATDKGTCIRGGVRVRDIERCLFRRGRDLFGNKVTAILTIDPAKKDSDPATTPISVKWNGIPDEPTYLVVVRTADGSVFSTELKYFPNFTENR
jgi:hypothetical protein